MAWQALNVPKQQTQAVTHHTLQKTHAQKSQVPKPFLWVLSFMFKILNNLFYKSI